MDNTVYSTDGVEKYFQVKNSTETSSLKNVDSTSLTVVKGLCIGFFVLGVIAAGSFFVVGAFFPVMSVAPLFAVALVGVVSLLLSRLFAAIRDQMQ